MVPLSTAWRAFRALAWAQRLWFLRAWLLLPLVASGLRLFGFRRVRAALGAGNVRAPRYDLPASRDVARLVDGAAHWNPVPARCLARSLVLCYLLRRQNLAAELHIGVARTEGHIAFHAWVEHDGVALNDSQDVAARYASFGEAWLWADGNTL